MSGIAERASDLSVPFSSLLTGRVWMSLVSLIAARLKMGHVCNLSPLHRPPTPSLDRGPVQRRVRRAFIAMDKPVLSTSQIVEWTHPRPDHGAATRSAVGGRDHEPALAQLVGHRTCPKAGCSIAGATTASSTSCATRFHIGLEPQPGGRKRLH